MLRSFQKGVVQYYGARYYEPKTSLWVSTDPLQEKYFNNRL